MPIVLMFSYCKNVVLIESALDFRFKNEFPEFIPSLALVSVVSAASKSVFTECREN